MDSIQKSARVAGFLYLLMVVSGLFSLIYAPGKLVVPDNASATAARILASESFYRINMVNGLVGTILFLVVAMALYHLLKDVNRQYAAAMVILVAVQTPLGVLSVMNQIAALDALHAHAFWSAFGQPQREALAMSLFDPANRTTTAIEVLWGLWLIPLAILVYRSGFLPRFLGVWLWINGLVYVVMSCSGLMWPQYSNTLKSIAFPAMLGEPALALWLAIVGARPKAAAPAARAA